MSRVWSVSAQRPYGRARVCRVWGVARSSYYARRRGSRPETSASGQRSRRGRPPQVPDTELVAAMRSILAEMEALELRGEGYRKVWARLRFQGYAVGKERVRRLMREYGLQAPHKAGNEQGPRVHDGTIIPEAPNVMWGTDATSAWTRLEGQATIFVAVDHYAPDCVGIHAARPGTRFEALEPIYQGLRAHFGAVAKGVAEALTLRHDNGPQYVSDRFQQELAFLGIEPSPSFAYAPEGNGVAERFIRTLKEQLLWVHTFDTVEELRQALLDFARRYNRYWILQRHGYRIPDLAREAALAQPAVAA